MKLSKISENQMADALVDKLGPNHFAAGDLQKPSDAEPEKSWIQSGGGAGPRKKRHRRFMRVGVPEPGI